MFQGEPPTLTKKNWRLNLNFKALFRRLGQHFFVLTINYDYRQFLCATILDFMTSNGCLYCQEAEILLCGIIENRMTS